MNEDQKQAAIDEAFNIKRPPVRKITTSKEPPDLKAAPPELRAQVIARWEKEGRLDPNCSSCQERYNSPRMPYDVMMPSHTASDRCESGKRNHCSCDTCF